MGELWQTLLQHAHHGGIAGQGGRIGSHRHLDSFGGEIASRTALIPGDMVRAFVVAMDFAARLGVGRFHRQPAHGTDQNAPQGVDQLRVGFAWLAGCQQLRKGALGGFPLLPGNKSLMLAGVFVLAQHDNTGVPRAFHQLTDASRRPGIVLHPLRSRGTGSEVSSPLGAREPTRLPRVLNNRSCPAGTR